MVVRSVEVVRVWDDGRAPRLVEVIYREGMQVLEAMVASGLWSEGSLPNDGQPVVFARPVAWDTVCQPGDRVSSLPALRVDPKAARQARVG